MWFKVLRIARIAVSLMFFLLIAFLFIDFTNAFSSGLTSGILFFQFVPSIIKFIHLLGLIFIGFIIVLILTLLFGRVYCSFLCPLGTLQDILRFFTNRFRRKKIFRFSPPKNFLRYSFLAITLLFVVFGSVFFVNLLDPYSGFGKIFSNLVRPVYYELNNLTAEILKRYEVYTLYPVPLKSYSWASFGYSFFLLGLIVWLVYRHGRLYCNTVCPVGTLLGIFSRFSIFQIRLDEALCNSCGVCGSVCKAECIDTKNRKVDFSRCVGCLNCLQVCTSSGVTFRPLIPSIKKVGATPSTHFKRRSFLKHSGLITTGIMVVAKDSFSDGLNNGMVPVVREYPVTPPGSLSIAHFTGSCTACHLCVSACPTHVLQPSLFQYGLAGIMQPHMDFLASFCNFECIICSEVCPTGAILPVDLQEKKLIQLGISIFIKENCIVYTDEKDCGACSEHCPTKAVNMVSYKNGLTIPEVTKDICIGCGACEYACPTTPKSIYVDGNPVHKQAKEPVMEAIETEGLPDDDFPF
jgi:polyferredoxin